MGLPKQILEQVAQRRTRLKDLDPDLLVQFFEFLKASNRLGITGYRSDDLQRWRDAREAGKLVALEHRKLVKLCDTFERYPHKEPRLPCLTAEKGQELWAWLRSFGIDEETWQVDHSTLLDGCRISLEEQGAGLGAEPSTRTSRTGTTIQQGVSRWIRGDQGSIATFVDEQQLIATANAIDLFLYTGETALQEWRHLFFERFSAEREARLRLRVLVRDAKADSRKAGKIRSLYSDVELLKGYEGATLDVEIRHYWHEPMLRAYFFELPDDRTVCLSGFYSYNPKNSVRFEGGTKYQRGLMVLSTEDPSEVEMIGRLRSRFDYAWCWAGRHAVIFDMDGVLVDGMKHHFAAWLDAFRDCDLLIDIDSFRTEIYRREGENVRKTARDLYAKYAGREASADILESILDMRERKHRELATEIRPMDGILEVLDFLREERIRLAVVTGSSRAVAGALIERLFPGRFEGIVCGDDLDEDHGKPHPAPYQAALAKLELPANKCLVVENAPLGVTAAHEAGIATYGVLIDSPLEESDLKPLGADAVFRSHAQLEAALRYPQLSARQDVGRTSRSRLGVDSAGKDQ